MTTKTNLKHRIRSGQTTVGAATPLTATKSRIEDIIGSSDYSFLSVDSQHNAYGERALVEICEAADQVGVRRVRQGTEQTAVRRGGRKGVWWR